jgi:branched-chain amino acid transport system ATP-binding protein
LRAGPGPTGSAVTGDASRVAGDEVLLRADGLSRSYDGVHAVAEVSIEIGPQQMIGLIGPNGAGKTTLINLLTGFDFPTEGTIAFAGQDITRWSARRRARAGMTRTFQHGHLFPFLSLRENVELGSLGVGTRGREARRVAGELLVALGLADRGDVPAGALSHGEQQKAGVARALASRPRFVLLDEPAAGLSEDDVTAFAELLERMRAEFGASVLVVEHNVALIMRVSDRIHVLDGGRTLAVGSPSEIRENIDVTAAYLGSAGTDAAIDIPVADEH